MATNDTFAKKRKIDEIKEKEKRMSWYDMCATTDEEDEEETEKANEKNMTKMAKMSMDEVEVIDLTMEDESVENVIDYNDGQ
jgi:ABC-type uncharacterized transport system ATPase subunit